MRIEAKLQAEVAAFNVKPGCATIDIEVGVKQDGALKIWGDEFESLAFSSMRLRDGKDETSVEFLVDKVTPGKRVVMEVHQIDYTSIDKVKVTLKGQPELRCIKTCPGEAKVIACLRLPVPLTFLDAAQVHELVESVGVFGAFDFSPAQQVLDLQTKEPSVNG